MPVSADEDDLLERRLRQALAADERVSWSGRPDPSVLFTSFDIVFVPLTMLWCAFAVFWNVMVNTGGAPLFFRLWGLPFLAAGAYAVVGRSDPDTVGLFDVEDDGSLTAALQRASAVSGARGASRHRGG